MNLPTTNDDKAAAWDQLVAQLNQTLPDWVETSDPAGAAACFAVRRLSSAANFEEYSTLRMHLRNELSMLRSTHENCTDPKTKAALFSHVGRINRMV